MPTLPAVHEVTRHGDVHGMLHTYVQLVLRPLCILPRAALYGMRRGGEVYGAQTGAKGSVQHARVQAQVCALRAITLLKGGCTPPGMLHGAAGAIMYSIAASPA